MNIFHPHILSKKMKAGKFVMISGSFLLLLLFVVPIWRITLEAPQYPKPIGMEIWINKITDLNENDIKNINLMNHYVGMKPIPEHMEEFDIFPPFAIGMSILGIILGIIGKRPTFIIWSVLMMILGALAIYDFYLWEYDYGHTLNPKAAIKIPGQGYQPPLIGSKVILNFKAVSTPIIGSYILFISTVSGFIGYYISRKHTD